MWINYYRSLYNSPKKSFLSDLFPLLGHNGLHFAFFVLDAFPTLFKLQSNAIQLGGHGIWKMEEKKSLTDWIYIYEVCVLTRKINLYIQFPACAQYTSWSKRNGNWCVCKVGQASIEQYPTGRPWRIKITKKSLNDGKSNTVKLCFDEKNRTCNSTSGARKN